MLEYEVTSWDGLIAAITAASQSTYELAHKNPVLIKFKSATYKFPNGIHERRAATLRNNIRKRNG